MPKKKTIPISYFAPDMVDYDSPHMEVCENMVPVRGEYMPVFGGQDIGEVSDSYRVISAYTHLLSKDLDVQTARAEAGVASYYWISTRDRAVDSDGWEMIDEVTPDDNDYVYDFETNTSSPSFTSFRVKLSDLDEPGVDTGHTLSIRWRGWEGYGGTTTSHFIADIYTYDGVSTWTKVTQSGNLIDEGIIASGEWLTTTATILTADVTANIATDEYDDLYLVVSPTMSLSGQSNSIQNDPVSDSLIDDADEWSFTGGEVTIWQSVAYSGTPDTTYATTPAMSDSEKRSVRFPISYDNTVKIAPDDYPIINIRAKSSSATDVYIDYVKLYKDGEEVFSNTSSYEIDDSFDLYDYSVLPYSIFEEWEYWEGLEVEIGLENQASSGSSNTYDPTVSGYNGFTKKGSSSAVHVIVSDDSDSTYMESPAESTTGNFVVTIEDSNQTEPANHENTKLRAKIKKLDGSPKLRLKISDGTETYQKDFNADRLSTDWAWVTFSLSSEQSESLDWESSDFDITVQKPGSNGQFGCSEVELQTSDDAVTVSLSTVYVDQTIGVGYDVSWAKFTVPNQEVDVTGDVQRIYFGTQLDLYELESIDTGVINDVTNDDLDVSNKYGSGDVPKIWDFCSWGGNVIATNWSDPVQFLDLENDSTQFDNLITNVDGGATLDLDANPEDAPRAKFCAVVQNSLVLANLNYSGYFSYDLCWSHINDPRQFSFPSYTYLSDYQSLLQTPGEITGLVGGDYGTIFKRNSIYRMSYVGSPLIYRFDVVARDVGTGYPKSIVTAGDDIYFYGNDAFYVMRGGGTPEPISEGMVSRMFSDNPLETYLASGVSLNARSLYPLEQNAEFKVDSLLYGTYDRTNSLIYWIYTCPGDSAFWRKTKALVYNTKSGKWGQVDFRNLRTYDYEEQGYDRFRHVSVATGLLNNQQDVVNRFGGIVMFSKHDTSATNAVWRPISSYTRPARIETAILSSKSLGFDEGDVISIKKARPIFYNADTQSYFIKNMSLRVTSSMDPYFNNTSSDTAYHQEYYDVHNVDESGWFNMKPIAGEFFSIRMDFNSWPSYRRSIADLWYGPVSGIVAIQFELDKVGSR